MSEKEREREREREREMARKKERGTQLKKIVCVRLYELIEGESSFFLFLFFFQHQSTIATLFMFR